MDTQVIGQVDSEGETASLNAETLVSKAFPASSKSHFSYHKTGLRRNPATPPTAGAAGLHRAPASFRGGTAGPRRRGKHVLMGFVGLVNRATPVVFIIVLILGAIKFLSVQELLKQAEINAREAEQRLEQEEQKAGVLQAALDEQRSLTLTAVERSRHSEEVLDEFRNKLLAVERSEAQAKGLLAGDNTKLRQVQADLKEVIGSAVGVSEIRDKIRCLEDVLHGRQAMRWQDLAPRLSACVDDSFTMGTLQDLSARASRDCVSWRQTGDCDPDGPREPDADQACHDVIPGERSGYCECANGTRVRGECGHPIWTCNAACERKIDTPHGGIKVWRPTRENLEKDVGTFGGIPKIIWQTGHTLKPEQLALQTIWRAMNPDWDYRFLDDVAAKEFMQAHFGEETNRAYDCYPRGFMRADLLRYAVMSKYGGVYADQDTFTILPINIWLAPWVAGKQGFFPIALESKAHLCQWGLVAPGNHAFHRQAVERLVQKAASVNFKIPTAPEQFPHFTGSAIWTEAVGDVLLDSSEVSEWLKHDNRAEELLQRCRLTHCDKAEFANPRPHVPNAFGLGAYTWTFGYGSMINFR